MWLSVCEALKRFLSFIFLGKGLSFLAISMWRFVLCERIPPSRRRVGRNSLFPRRVSLPASGLPPGAGSPPGAGWSLPPFPVRGGSFLLLLAERPATAATYSMFVAELRASKSSFPSNGARVTRSALRFNNDTRILEIQGHERCISAMRWRIIKEQQRCWLLLAFRFRAYTPALFLRSLLLCRQQTDAYPAIFENVCISGKRHVCFLNIPSQSHLHQDGDEINSGHCKHQAPIFSANFHFENVRNHLAQPRWLGSTHCPAQRASGGLPPNAPFKLLTRTRFKSSSQSPERTISTQSPDETIPPKAPMKNYTQKRLKNSKKSVFLVSGKGLGASQVSAEGPAALDGGMKQSWILLLLHRHSCKPKRLEVMGFSSFHPVLLLASTRLPGI